MSERTRPPTPSLASSTVTACPASQHARAQARPETPAPTMTTRLDDDMEGDAARRNVETLVALGMRKRVLARWTANNEEFLETQKKLLVSQW